MRVPCLAAALFATTAAAPPPPAFDAIRFFTGATAGRGDLKVVFRKPSRIAVEGHGRVEGDTLILDQTIAREGSAPRSRQWRIHRIAPDRYAGTLTDAKGPITGETTGDRLHLHYTGKDGFAIDQWLTLAPGGRSARNRLTAKRFGITVATLDETIVKRD